MRGVMTGIPIGTARVIMTRVSDRPAAGCALRTGEHDPDPDPGQPASRPT
jgi:hypothetical protein